MDIQVLWGSARCGIMVAMNLAEDSVVRQKVPMSLKRKIVLLFLGLAVVPMLIVATFSFFYAAWLAEGITKTRLADTAVRAANELDAASLRVQQSLVLLQQLPSLQEALEGSADGEARLEPLVAGAPLVTVRDGSGTVLASWGGQPDSPIRCDSSGGSRMITIRAALSGSMRAEAGVWAGDLLPIDLRGPMRAVRVIDGKDGSILYSPDCSDLVSGGSVASRAALAALSGGPSEWESFRFRDDTGGWNLGTVQPSPDGQRFTVASASVHVILAPLSRLEAWYWFFVLTLALSTALAFSLLLGRVTHSLNDLTRAAARIGQGDFQPWLPPPGNDEVGRLTLAFSDMLDRVRRTMDHVDQNGRLAVVGQLSSYLAHEIRNPLTSIKMNLQRLQRSAQSGRIPSDCRDAVDISLKEVDRLAGSVTSILQLGRADQGPRDAVSLHRVVEDAAELLRGEFLRAGIGVDVELDASADRVVAVLGQLKGVFLNLMMNALEAQPEGGRLEVRSELQPDADGSPLVAIRIRDFGIGVPAAVRDRIFEPFFTTKPTGSGIGLAVVARTLRDSGGDIYLEDLPISEKGAEFVVTLPLAAVTEAEHAIEAGSTPNRLSRPWIKDDAETGVPVSAGIVGSSPVPANATEPAPALSADASEALAAWVKNRGHVH
jgi:signal transduction histidine kinase